MATIRVRVTSKIDNNKTISTGIKITIKKGGK
jgi:hypothetical protein